MHAYLERWRGPNLFAYDCMYEPDHMRLRKSIYNDYSLSRKLKFSDCVRLRNTFKTIYKVYTFFDFVNKFHYKSIIWADDQAHCGLDGHTHHCNCSTMDCQKIWLNSSATVKYESIVLFHIETTFSTSKQL